MAANHHLRQCMASTAQIRFPSRLWMKLRRRGGLHLPIHPAVRQSDRHGRQLPHARCGAQWWMPCANFDTVRTNQAGTGFNRACCKRCVAAGAATRGAPDGKETQERSQPRQIVETRAGPCVGEPLLLEVVTSGLPMLPSRTRGEPVPTMPSSLLNARPQLRGNAGDCDVGGAIDLAVSLQGHDDAKTVVDSRRERSRPEDQVSWIRALLPHLGEGRPSHRVEAALVDSSRNDRPRAT